MFQFENLMDEVRSHSSQTVIQSLVWHPGVLIRLKFFGKQDRV